MTDDEHRLLGLREKKPAPLSWHAARRGPEGAAADRGALGPPHHPQRARAGCGYAGDGRPDDDHLSGVQSPVQSAGRYALRRHVSISFSTALGPNFVTRIGLKPQKPRIWPRPARRVAVDHWNTDNFHVHILVRGVAETGEHLVIGRDYIRQGNHARSRCGGAETG
ncbi:hypothetical protein [Sphingobium baderi]|uniref:Uncharacterized protein n=1 Tax=Sphingobium baderi TaxID=1332080 RepID=A0A0S3F038_9SPHN|nr:hypothetical protein [Sphingobium baderi]ALR21003.1 hypothetical protein ATN00_12520 [Sphingobium baderi]